jgi:hypothetical protein
LQNDDILRVYTPGHERQFLIRLQNVHRSPTGISAEVFAASGAGVPVLAAHLWNSGVSLLRPRVALARESVWAAPKRGRPVFACVSTVIVATVFRIFAGIGRQTANAPADEPPS